MTYHPSIERDSWELRTKDRLEHGLPETFDVWMYYKTIREHDNLVVVADRPRPNVVSEPAYRPLWADTDHGREPTAASSQVIWPHQSSRMLAPASVVQPREVASILGAWIELLTLTRSSSNSSGDDRSGRVGVLSSVSSPGAMPLRRGPSRSSLTASR